MLSFKGSNLFFQYIPPSFFSLYSLPSISSASIRDNIKTKLRQKFATLCQNGLLMRFIVFYAFFMTALSTNDKLSVCALTTFLTKQESHLLDFREFLLITGCDRLEVNQAFR